MISSVWTKDEDKDFPVAIKNNPVLRKFHKLLSKRLEDLNSELISEEDLSDPSWAYKQAYLNGRKAELQQILKGLLGFCNE